MITPLDIQNKEFSKAVRGYKEEEVDNFLDLLTLDYEKLVKENYSYKEQIKALNQEIERYKNAESAVYETLESAKTLMGDISASAEKRASMLLKNAELDAQLILREARESVEKLNEEYASIRTRLHIFKTRFKTLLESELERFDTLSAEIFSDNGLDDLRKLAGGTEAVQPAGDPDRPAAGRPDDTMSLRGLLNDEERKTLAETKIMKAIKSKEGSAG